MAYLDDGFSENPKVAGLHDRAFRFHVTALQYCSRNLTDGYVDARAVKVIAALLEIQSKRWVKQLTESGLWRAKTDGSGYFIHDYLKYNDSAEERQKLRDAKRVAGRKGGLKKAENARLAASEPATPATSSSHSSSYSSSRSEHQKPDQIRRTKDSDLSGLTSTSYAATDEGLPFTNELLIAKLLRQIGTHADQNTGQVIRALANGLPEASIARVTESLNDPTIRNRAAYAVTALTTERNERNAA